MTESRPVASWKWGQREGSGEGWKVLTKGNKETLGCDGCVHCLDGGDRLYDKHMFMPELIKLYTFNMYI